MGFYIDEIKGKHIGTTFEEKSKALLDAGAEEVDGKEYQENLVVLVDNGFFAAAGYAFSEKEHAVFQDPRGRRTKWFVVPNAAKHSGYEDYMKSLGK